MQHFFHVTEAQIQLLLSINFLGLCISGLFYGPLSDSYGRKTLLVMGLLIFAIGGVGSVFADTFSHLLFWRFLQGVGSSAAFVIPGAIIFDLYQAEEAAEILGFINSLITTVMAGAPMLGTYLYLHYDWRANFFVIAIIALSAFLVVQCGSEESLPKNQRTKFNLIEIMRGFYLVLTDRITLANLVIFCAIISAYMVFVSNLSLIYLDHLHVSPSHFPWHQGSVLISFAIVSMTSGRLFSYFGVPVVKMAGIIINTLGAILFGLTALFTPNNPLLITSTMCVFSIGVALMMNLIFGDYMERFPHIKGISSALASSLRLLANVVAITTSGIVFTGTIRPVAIIMLALTAISSYLLYRLSITTAIQEV